MSQCFWHFSLVRWILRFWGRERITRIKRLWNLKRYNLVRFQSIATLYFTDILLFFVVVLFYKIGFCQVLWASVAVVSSHFENGCFDRQISIQGPQLRLRWLSLSHLHLNSDDRAQVFTMCKEEVCGQLETSKSWGCWQVQGENRLVRVRG